MTNARPFVLVEKLFESAETTWFSLLPDEWKVAFAEYLAVKSESSLPIKPFRADLASSISALDDLDCELAAARRLYEDKFGFIFAVCGGSKTIPEIVSMCRTRLRNSAEIELRLAADEHKRIIETNLNFLLEQ